MIGVPSPGPPSRAVSAVGQLDDFYRRGSAQASAGLDRDEAGDHAAAAPLYRAALVLFARGLQVTEFAPEERARAATSQARIRSSMQAVEQRLNDMPTVATPASAVEPPSLLERLARLLVKTPSAGNDASTEGWFAVDSKKEQKPEPRQEQQRQQLRSASVPQQLVGPSSKPSKEDDAMLLAGVDKATQRRILDVAVDGSPGIAWSDIAGLDEAKRTLYEAVILPSLRPDFFSGLRKPASGVLLFGPPGCGKTMLAKAVATEAKCAFFSISAASLMSKYLGESETLVKGLFSVARYVAPAVIFLDEIDSLLSERSDKEHEASRRVKTEFLIQWDGLQAGGGSDKRILVMGATNRPFDLDEAALRRMPQRVYIPLPDGPARRLALVNLLSETRHALSYDDMNWVVEHSEGFSQSDLKNLCQQAAMEPIRELGGAQVLTAKLEQLRGVLRRDFEAAFKYARPSVDQSSLQKFQEFKQKFGM